MAGFDPKAYRATQSQQFSGTPVAPAQPERVVGTATEALMKPFQERGVFSGDHEEKDKQSFVRKVGEDALLLGLAPSAIASTAVDFAMHPIKTTGQVATGFVEGYLKMFDGREWKEHPLLNTVNTVANISVVGGIIKSLAMNGVRTSVLETAIQTGVKAGGDAVIIKTLFKDKKFLNNAIREGEKLGSAEPVVATLSKYYERAGMASDAAVLAAKEVGEGVFGKWLTENGGKMKAINTVAHPVAAMGSAYKYVSRPIAETVFGKPEISAVGKLYGSDVVKQDVPGFALVEEWASNQVVESGLKDTVTNRVRKIQDWVDENPEYASLTPLERNRHFAEYAKADLSRKKFAEAKGNEYVLTKALPKNYIEAIVEYIKNLPKHDADGKPLTNGKIIEELEKAYGQDFKMHSQEVRNRMKGNLESEARDLLIKSVGVLGDSRVPVSLRGLTKGEATLVAELEGTGYRIGRAPAKTKISQAADLIEADSTPYYHGSGDIFETIKSTNQMREEGIDVRPSNIGGNSPFVHLTEDKILAEQYAKMRGRHIGGSPKVYKYFIDGKILDLSKDNMVGFNLLERGDPSLIRQIKEGGYVGVRFQDKHPGSGAIVSTVAVFPEHVKTKVSYSSKSNKFAREDLLTRRSMLGRLVDKFGLSPEGVVEGSQFFQFRETFIQKLIAKYGYEKNITIGGAKYPVRSMHNTLETLRKIQQQNTSGVFPYNYSIADLRYNNLVKMGFSEADAKAIDAILRESNVTSPAVTGMLEAISNYARTRRVVPAGLLPNKVAWLDPFVAYEKFLRVQSDWRFKKNPMFAMQAAMETVTWSALFMKRVPGTDLLAKYVNKIPGLEKPLIQSLGEPTIPQQAMVLEEVLRNYTRQLRDGSSPEIYRGTMESTKFTKTGVEGFAERMQFESRTSDSNVWLGAASFSNVKIATNLMKNYAGRFGMTLEDALSFTMTPGGKKVYNHPEMLQKMQDVTQGIFGYHGAVLNSPLIRTLNVVFFPLRFQTKSVIQTSKWLSDLSPASRLAVVNQWVSTAYWLETDEGKKWNKERGVLAGLFNYTFAYEGLGKTVNAVTKGELFGGNAGLIGGLPFGFLVNIARDLGYFPESEQINPSTGKPYERKIIKDASSFPAFVKAVEDVIISITPAMPFYTATGGAVTVSANREIRKLVQQVLGGIAAGLDPEKDIDDYKKIIRKSEKKVKPEFSR